MRNACERLLIRTDVSAVSESLWAERLTFRDRRLDEFDVVYLFLDAIFEPLRRTETVKDGVPVAWRILRAGRRVPLHLAMDSRENHGNWLEFLRDMVRRGLRVPLSITTDDAPGPIRAVETMWPHSLRSTAGPQGRNILDKVPDEMSAAISPQCGMPNTNRRQACR